MIEGRGRGRGLAREVSSRDGEVSWLFKVVTIEHHLLIAMRDRLSQELICSRQPRTLAVDVKQGEAAETTIWLLRSYGCVGELFTIAVARSHGRCR